MPKLTMEATRGVMYNILEEFATFCDAHGLRYYLAYGTMLGAVRHHGFIPWDDDIDVMMPEEDFLKFAELYQSDRYEVVKCYTDRRVSLTMGRLYASYTYGIRHKRRVLGISIDIYLMYGTPEGEEALKEHIAKIQRLGRRAQRWRRYAGFISHHHLLPESLNIFSYMLTRCTHGRVRQYGKYRFGEGPYTFITTDTRRYGKDIFAERVLMPFEDKSFYVPSGWDKCLTIRYKDYMQLPPESERHPLHQASEYFMD